MTIKDTIYELDSLSRDYDHYEYGLPTHNEYFMAKMETEVKKLVEFHVEAALKAASENGEVDYELNNPYDANSQYAIVDKNSILNAYPLENIK